MRFLILFLLLFFSASHCADINCSSGYVSSLPSCSWSLSCSSQSWCFHGEFGVWGNVYRCNPGGYYDTSPEFSYACASWDSNGAPGDGGVVVGDSSSFSALSQTVEVLIYLLLGSLLLFSFFAGLSFGGRL